MTPDRAAAFLETPGSEVKSWKQIFDDLKMPKPTYRILKACLADALQQARADLQRENDTLRREKESAYKQGVEDAHRCEQRHARIDELERENAELKAQHGRDEEYYEAAMTMSEKHRKNWVKAEREREQAIREKEQWGKLYDDLCSKLDDIRQALAARQGEE